jgi:hypothetical protein
MEIQQVFIFFNNLRHLVSKILASFVNFKNFLIRTMNEKKKDYNIDSMWDTKGNLDNKTTAKLVQCVTCSSHQSQKEQLDSSCEITPM